MRRMGIGLGVGINRSNYAQGIFSAYQSRVVADGGVTEAGACVDAVSGLLQTASLLLIPSGYKGGKAYAEIPTNGNGDLTWTRASDAWRTNADGLIQRVPWNLVQYSEDFSNGAWTKIATTVATNTTTAPDGNTTADTVTENTATGRHFAFAQFTTVSGSVYSASIYVKNLSRRYVTISLKNVSPSSPVYSATFDLNSGTNTTTFSGGTPLNTSNFITNVGNGWYRIGVSMQAASASTYFEIGLSNSATPSYSEGMATYTGDGTSALYYYGGQVVEGSSAQTYFPTTDRLNVPRLSYMYGSCPALLLEPQRTNLVLWSNDFTNVLWNKSGPTITANTTISPDGLQNASTVTFTASSQFLAQTCLPIGINATASVYILGTSGETIQVACGGVDQLFTLNGSWQRISLNRPTTTTTSVNINTFGGATARVVRIYGFQAEVGSYATTIIPTTTASATRIADSFSRNNIYTNGLITSSGGTWFVELRGNIAYKGDGAGDGIFLRTNGDTDNFRLYSDNSATTRVIIFKRVSNVNTQIYTTTTDTTKIAFKWNGSTADVFANGTKVVSATVFTATQMQDFVTSITGAPKFIQSMALYPTPLSDTDCTTLTTL
jgi:hypothetical protein